MHEFVCIGSVLIIFFRSVPSNPSSMLFILKHVIQVTEQNHHNSFTLSTFIYLFVVRSFFWFAWCCFCSSLLTCISFNTQWPQKYAVSLHSSHFRRRFFCSCGFFFCSHTVEMVLAVYFMRASSRSFIRATYFRCTRTSHMTICICVAIHFLCRIRKWMMMMILLVNGFNLLTNFNGKRKIHHSMHVLNGKTTKAHTVFNKNSYSFVHSNAIS